MPSLFLFSFVTVKSQIVSFSSRLVFALIYISYMYVHTLLYIHAPRGKDLLILDLTEDMTTLVGKDMSFDGIRNLQI